MSQFQPPESEFYQAALEKMVREQRLAVEGLTEKQLAEALRQALACGDFIRNVRVDNQAQSVVYVPYANEERSKSETERLKKLIRDILACLHINLLRQTMTTLDDREFEGWIDKWCERIDHEPT